MLFVESACKRYMSDKWSLKSVFSWRHGAMLVSQTSPVGVELFTYVNNFFCSNKFARLLVTRVKTLYSFPAGICQVTSLLLHKQKGYWLITKGKIHHFTCYMLQQEFPPLWEVLTASFIFLSTSLAERGGVTVSGDGILTGERTGDTAGSYDAWNRYIDVINENKMHSCIWSHLL